MLGRSEWSPRRLDANALVQDVAVLIESDAVLRNVAVSFDFAPEPVYVNGNRIDLEQALLNVVTNAMDAVADRPVPQRIVDIQTRQDERRRSAPRDSRSRHWGPGGLRGADL